MPADLKTEVEARMSEAPRALQGTDSRAVRGPGALSEAMQKIGAAVYAAGGAPRQR
ncbi:MAG: hypothetical protein U0531_00235 [Dehalococcoidia bacterium]